MTSYDSEALVIGHSEEFNFIGLYFLVSIFLHDGDMGHEFVYVTAHNFLL